ncbi:FtsX-like permease family protein [Zoogloea sp.]|uniref:ABC transporter permease n=1 Tax=Zoogloea sp. TaxID=49181 RepID=UPI0025D9699F|nr:FtsX-like permease family protein [Zoogloea sp.]MCK6392577.1 FtsX-like permease family protein [Zoogloea sp.]
MKHLLNLGLRNLLRNRIRTAITLGAIVFGVCGLIVSGGFVRDIFVQLAEALIHSQSGHAQVGQEAIFGAGSRSPERYLLKDPDTLRKTLQADPEVKDVMARITFSGLLNNGKTDYAIIAEGIEPDRELALGTHLRVLSGRMLKDSDRFGAMLGEGVAAAMNLAPGDQATLVVSTLDGATNTLDIEVVGVFQSFSKDFDARAVRISLGAAQDLLLTKGVGKLVVSLRSTDGTDAFIDRMKPQLAADLRILDWRTLNDFYQKTVDIYQQQFGFLQAMVLLMVCLSVINTLNMSLLERGWEFGTMRALGNRSKTIVSLIVLESLVLGVVGATLGLLLGLALAMLISGVGIPMPPPPNAEIGYDAYIRIVPAVLLQSWVVGIVATLLASLYPAFRSSRVPIIDALRSRA